MKIMQWISFLVILCAVAANGLWPNLFEINSFSILLLFLLAIPLLAPYLKRAKLLGAEVDFKDEIQQADDYVQLAEAQAESKGKNVSTSHHETFSTEMARQLLDVDPNLSMAALRIEMFRVFSLAVSVMLGDIEIEPTIENYLDIYHSNEKLTDEQSDAIKIISRICDEAVHGAPISVEQAEKLIELTERLNKGFSVGWSLNFRANPNFREQGLLCEWEHCVEYLPLQRHRNELSCPVWGHDCPGGIEVAKACDIGPDDIPSYRYTSSSKSEVE